jgi:hypothetical protein
MKKILSANAPIVGVGYFLGRHSASQEHQEQAVRIHTGAKLLADIGYERVCRKRVFYRGLLRTL